MPKKTFTPEQIVAKLRQIEVLVSQGKTVILACKDGTPVRSPGFSFGSAVRQRAQAHRQVAFTVD